MMIFLFIIINQLSALSFNQPKFCPTANWNSNGITIADQAIVGRSVYGLFIDIHNTVYIANYQFSIILLRFNSSVNRTMSIADDFLYPYSIFVINNGDIFIDSGRLTNRVDRWISSTDEFVTVMNVNAACFGLFVDNNDTLYCSISKYHQVVKRWLHNNETPIEIVAGTGDQGDDSNQLDGPRGIFVDINFDLYVADCGNDRIQLFQFNEADGKTVAGETSLFPTISLYCPSGVLLDYDKNLFITDHLNHRIISSGSNGFRCIIGCYEPGSESHQLSSPFTLSFDSYGNIFVTDELNHRVQKYLFLENSCDNSSTMQSVYTFVLISNSSKYFQSCSKLDSYYQAIKITVVTTGLYIVVSDSNIDTYGYIYKDNFNPYNSVENLLAKNDQGAGKDQFKLEVTLEINTVYVLVVTTYDSNVTGNFSVIVTGPSKPNLTRIRDSPSAVQCIYPSEITTTNSIYFESCSRVSSYYQQIQIKVTISGFYTFLSNSNVIQHGYIYKNQFNPLNPDENLLSQNSWTCRKPQFHVVQALQANTTYMLVVTTLESNDTENFSILVSGPDVITFNRIFNTSSIFQSIYSSTLTANSSTYFKDCSRFSSYYEAIQIEVATSGLYTIQSRSPITVHGFLYEQQFNPFNPSANLLLQDMWRCGLGSFKLIATLQKNTTYMMIVTTYDSNMTGDFLVYISGPDTVRFKKTSSPSVTLMTYSSAVQLNYSSTLKVYSQNYSRDCRNLNYYYETIQVNVVETGYYGLISSSDSDVNTFGDVYENNFRPINPFENLLKQDYRSCSYQDFKLIAYLQPNIKYILVVTTNSPNKTGNFSILASGPNNISFHHFVQISTDCSAGGKCQFYRKTIGITLDDILRDKFQTNMALRHQPISVHISIFLTMIMFAGGLTSSFFSLSTFHNPGMQDSGCGMYLLSISITSLLTNIMFTIKLWFLVLTQMNVTIRVSILRGACTSIEPLLKLFLYLDSWLNACIAIERAFLVHKGIKFNKKKSKHTAHWIIMILPFLIMSSIIYEPFYRHLPEITTEVNKVEIYPWCITHYSPSLQYYNTIILFFHLIGPFVANLFSALFIIFGSARQRSAVQTTRTYKEHIIHQIHEHRHLLISPMILLILSLPRLVMAMLSECINASNYPFLFLSGYFISFIPSMLIFIIYVLPSKLYKKRFRVLLQLWRSKFY